MNLSLAAGTAQAYCGTCHMSLHRPGYHVCHYSDPVHGNGRKCPDCEFGYLDCCELAPDGETVVTVES